MSRASSPCVGVCAIDEPSGRCLGCGRTLDEVVGWGGMTEPQRLAVMALLPERLAGGPPGAPREGAEPWTGAS